MAILSGNAGNDSGDRLLTVGLTGGMGSGKSVVCGMLETRGARVFDADEVGKNILRTDSASFDLPSRESDLPRAQVEARAR